MTEVSDSPEDPPLAHPPTRPTWITPLVVIICAGVFIGLLMQGDYESQPALAKFGLLMPDVIWEGAYWALVTPAFIHFEIWHLALNLYWLWRLGSMLERRIGYLPYLAFYLIAAFVGSSAQLAGSGSTGIGASGVVYAIFGFMWVSRKHYPEFSGLLDDRTIKGFLVWAVACIVLTRLNLLQVANAAHFAGLVFGVTVGVCVAFRRWRVPMTAGVIGLIAASIVPLFWAPWSVPWLAHKAYEAHVEKRYEVAVAYYTRMLSLDSKNSWAYQNRAYANLALGHDPEGDSDMRRAVELDPTIKDGE